eukprot:GILI01020846.1.p1 GENE.GILI01020846.1~~GILI01020846.1.p1  ORF type:complete len:171 (+),score=5.54 GILI01020846.1:142-654(+)
MPCRIPKQPPKLDQELAQLQTATSDKQRIFLLERLWTFARLDSSRTSLSQIGCVSVLLHLLNTSTCFVVRANTIMVLSLCSKNPAMCRSIYEENGVPIVLNYSRDLTDDFCKKEFIQLLKRMLEVDVCKDAIKELSESYGLESFISNLKSSVDPSVRLAASSVYEKLFPS